VGIVTKAEFDPHAKFLHEGPARIVIFTTQRTSNDQISLLKSHSAEVYADDSDRVDLQKALARLHQLGIRRLMVEGGATLNFELLRLGLVDEVSAYVAPMIFGGESAPTMAAGAGLARGAAIPLELIDMERWEDGGVILRYHLKRG
jgi:2,5-diamino-6-(ribosylamino)-4(3H)-pyrimidinone 5'-phosphate reductase